LIYRATKQHALNLAKFVSLYKTILLIQKNLNGGKERRGDTFVAGLIGGYFVFGERNAVNEQVGIVSQSNLFDENQGLLSPFRLCSTWPHGWSHPLFLELPQGTILPHNLHSQALALSHSRQIPDTSPCFLPCHGVL
jgi:hypothetical protein